MGKILKGVNIIAVPAVGTNDFSAIYLSAVVGDAKDPKKDKKLNVDISKNKDLVSAAQLAVFKDVFIKAVAEVKKLEGIKEPAKKQTLKAVPTKTKKKATSKKAKSKIKKSKTKKK